MIEKYVSEFRDSLMYVRSIDGFLIKLGTLVMELEDLCRDGGCSVEDHLRGILGNELLREVLGKFSCYLDDIVESINNDPRHKALRKYIGVIKEVLASIPCKREAEVEKTTPPALWLKESREREEGVRIKVIYRGRSWSDPLRILKYLLAFSIILFIIALIIATM
jgi:hypothetical protein